MLPAALTEKVGDVSRTNIRSYLYYMEWILGYGNTTPDDAAHIAFCGWKLRVHNSWWLLRAAQFAKQKQTFSADFELKSLFCVVVIIYLGYVFLVRYKVWDDAFLIGLRYGLLTLCTHVQTRAKYKNKHVLK